MLLSRRDLTVPVIPDFVARVFSTLRNFETEG